MDISWALNNSALSPFVKEKVASKDMEGKLLRVIMPNPLHPDSPTEADALVRDLTGPRSGVVTPEFGCVNPQHMWQSPTRYIWAAAADPNASASAENAPFPQIVKVDT